jgi:hypothetical protein
MNTEEFLKMYHEMVDETINLPKIFKNIKEGDEIWYVHYSYRGNGKTKSYITINKYNVAELTEYYVDKHEDPFNPRSFFIHVIRPTRKYCMLDTADHSREGKWEDKIELDSLCEIFQKDMDKSLIVNDDTTYAYITVIGFNKDKVINTAKQIISQKAQKAKNNFKAFIEQKQKEFNEIENEYNDILNKLGNADN